MPESDESWKRRNVIALVRAGYKFRAIAAALDISTKTICAIVRQSGMRRKGMKLTAGERKTLQQLLARGTLKQTEIARRLRVHRSTVSRHAAGSTRRAGDPKPCRPRRCAVCRHLVVLWPCQICRVNQPRS